MINGRPSGTATTAKLLGEWLLDAPLLREPEQVIPHLAIEGRVTLLSGREKIGKSTLVAQMIASASRGEEVFGVALDMPRRTLVYSLDEPLGDTVRRLDRMGAAQDGIVINAVPRTWSETLDALESDLDSFQNIGAVVIDNLSRVLAATGVNPNQAHEVEPIMARYVDFFHRNNVAGILLYHTGKGGKEYRGSTSIGATVDDILTLRRRGQSEEDDFDDATSDDGRRLLVKDGRNLRGRLHLTFHEGLYSLFEESAETRERLLQTLRASGTITGRAEFAKRAGLRKGVALKVIAELVGSGTIVEKGKHLQLGSQQFPGTGTEAEPRREPNHVIGSPSGIPYQQDVGTESRGTRTAGGTLDRLSAIQHGDLRLPVNGIR